jgi:hypothetical protein
MIPPTCRQSACTAVVIPSGNLMSSVSGMGGFP